MTNARPNVLLLSVDTWRADRLSLYGYERPTTPALDAFAEDAIVCENAYTLGPYTQIACIQLFTSSRPFSYGGFDRGAQGRPETLFARFRRAGYRTFGLSTIHWVSPYYGYTDGLDEEIGAFLLNTLVGMAVNTMRDTVRVFSEGRMEESTMLATAAPVIRKLFENVDAYCDVMRRRGDRYGADFPDAKFVNDGYDFDKVQAVVARHRDAFERDPAGYVRRHLSRTPQPHQWLAADWHMSRTPGKLARETAFRAFNGIVAGFNPRLARLRANRYRLSVDAHAIADRVVRELGRADRDRPFFIWAHFKDTHQPFVAGPGRQWYRHTPRYLDALGHPPDLDPSAVFANAPETPAEWSTVSALYDAAVRSTDEAMGRIFAALDESGLKERTVVALCGDHGEELGDHGDYGHLAMHYEHNSRIPMIVRPAGGGGARPADLVTALDLAPTLTHLAGIDAARDWEGSPITSETVSRRDHIIMESLCRGNCDFDHRPVYMAVRTRGHKYIWKEYQDPVHEVGTAVPELYDLGDDPGERRNLYRPDHPLVPGFQRLIAARLAELPEIAPERIARAFGTERTERAADALPSSRLEVGSPAPGET